MIHGLISPSTRRRRRQAARRRARRRSGVTAASRLAVLSAAAMIGDVPDLGFLKIFRNVAKWASGVSSLDVVDSVVEGTLRRPLDSLASAWVSVVSHFTSAQAWSVC